ncbi:MAG: histidine phosphatase family protein, partial [Methylobacter sp.]|nr:histidine phosphatase family protein [Methylobacter sp.]
MTHELLLLRHAKSDWSVDMDDFSRPLKKRGRRAAKQMGRWLVKQQLIPDIILSSPATRALATAQRVCKQLGMDESAIICDPRIYEADAQTLLALLKVRRDERRVLLVGHNPGLEDLLLKLTP